MNKKKIRKNNMYRYTNHNTHSLNFVYFHLMNSKRFFFEKILLIHVEYKYEQFLMEHIHVILANLEHNQQHIILMNLFV